jgi:hypothetical protein
MSTPVITGISPASGSAVGGDTVTITGTGLTGATNVRFGPTSAAMTGGTDIQITVTSPPGTGTVDITVTTPAGTSAASPADQFTYAATRPAPAATRPAPAATRPAPAATRPAPAATAPNWQKAWYVASWALAAAFAGSMAVALLKSQWAQAFGTGTVFVGLALLTLLGGGSYGAFSALIGADGRTSTSKTQAGLWTVVLAWGIAYLLGRHIFEHQPLSRVLPQDTWDQYLLVLGGPFAAAVLAKGIVTYQLSNGTLTKTTVGPGAATINQVLQNDANQTALADSQYFLFNLVAIVYFLVQIARKPVLPTMPAVLLAATSGAAALYVGYKAVSTNKLIISSVVPRTARPGDLLTITGSNMLGGDPASPVQVQMAQFGSLDVQGKATESQVKATLPFAAPTGAQELFVVSGAGNSSDPYNIWVMADEPVIVGLDQPMVTPGQPITIYGRWFSSARLPDVKTVTVQFDGSNPTEGNIIAGADSTKPDSVTVTAPNSLGSKTMITVINASGAASSPFSAVVRARPQ